MTVLAVLGTVIWLGGVWAFAKLLPRELERTGAERAAYMLGSWFYASIALLVVAWPLWVLPALARADAWRTIRKDIRDAIESEK